MNDHIAMLRHMREWRAVCDSERAALDAAIRALSAEADYVDPDDVFLSQGTDDVPCLQVPGRILARFIPGSWGRAYSLFSGNTPSPADTSTGDDARHARENPPLPLPPATLLYENEGDGTKVYGYTAEQMQSRAAAPSQVSDARALLLKLIAQSEKQADECEAMAVRIHGTPAHELTRDASQYRQTIHQFGLVLAALDQPQPGRVEGWRPIETAPHGDVGPNEDRVAILVRTNYCDIRVEDARFVDRMRTAAVEDGEQCVFTHWMPIPPVPTAGGDA